MVVLTLASDDASGEQLERRLSYVGVHAVRPDGVRWAGIMRLARKSNGVFWGSAWRWSMGSSGLLAEDLGYVVREHWIFVHKKTKKRTERDVVRHYRLGNDEIMSNPPDELGLWPETRMPWPEPPPQDDE